MLELFVVGSVWFWALVVAELILLFVFTEYENGIAATVSLVAFGAALQFAGNADILGYMWHHPIHIGLAAIAYLLLGTGWGVFNWRNLVVHRLREHDELFSEFLRSNSLPANTTVLPLQYRKEWARWVERTKDYKTNQTVADVPLAKQHKARIMRWMSLWVFSVLLYLLKDLVRELFLSIYSALSNFLQRIADNLYAKRNVKENLEMPEEPKEEAAQRE
jgi:hypothetical protein